MSTGHFVNARSPLGQAKRTEEKVPQHYRYGSIGRLKLEFLLSDDLYGPWCYSSDHTHFSKKSPCSEDNWIEHSLPRVSPAHFVSLPYPGLLRILPLQGNFSFKRPVLAVPDDTGFDWNHYNKIEFQLFKDVSVAKAGDNLPLLYALQLKQEGTDGAFPNLRQEGSDGVSFPILK